MAISGGPKTGNAPALIGMWAELGAVPAENGGYYHGTQRVLRRSRSEQSGRSQKTEEDAVKSLHKPNCWGTEPQAQIDVLKSCGYLRKSYQKLRYPISGTGTHITP